MAIMTNKLILAALDEYVHGHELAKKTLITMLTRSNLRFFQKYVKLVNEDFLISPMKVLLIGPSGTGKTFLLESLAKIAPFPLVRLDATHLAPTSASGVTPEKVMSLIKEQAKLSYMSYPHLYFSEQGALDKTVVFIDEIDKLGTSFDGSKNWNKHTQSSFLTLFDNKTEFAGVSFVFAGAFTGLTNKEKASHLGFTSKDEVVKKVEITDEDIIGIGLIPEIVGRITAIVELEKFTKVEYKKILVDKILSKKYMDLAAYGVYDEVLDANLIDELVQKALNSSQGVRYLQREVDRLFLEIEFNADSGSPKTQMGELEYIEEDDYNDE